MQPFPGFFLRVHDGDGVGVGLSDQLNIKDQGKCMTRRRRKEYLDDGADGERESDENEKAEENCQDQSTEARRVRSS